MGNQACSQCSSDQFEQIEHEQGRQQQLSEIDNIIEMNFKVERENEVEEEVTANKVPYQNLQMNPISTEEVSNSNYEYKNTKRVVKNNNNMKPFVFEANITEMQGELFRVKHNTKQIYISRWCRLAQDGFTYHKSQYAALFEERPLREVPFNSIVSVVVYKNEKFFIEIHTSDILCASASNIIGTQSVEQLTTNSFSMTSRSHLMQRPKYLNPSPPSQSRTLVKTVLKPVIPKNFKKTVEHVRDSKNSWTFRENQMYLGEERLVFSINDEEE